jgi:hypothetical protein
MNPAFEFLKEAVMETSRMGQMRTARISSVFDAVLPNQKHETYCEYCTFWPRNLHHTTRTYKSRQRHASFSQEQSQATYFLSNPPMPHQYGRIKSSEPPSFRSVITPTVQNHLQQYQTSSSALLPSSLLPQARWLRCRRREHCQPLRLRISSFC